MPEKKIKDGKKINKKPRLLKATIVSRETTKRKEMDEKLKRASDEWRITFDAMEDSVMLIDRDYRIVRVNLATSKMLGLPFKEIIGKQCFRLLHGTDCPIESCAHQQTLADGKAHSTEIRHPGLEKDFLVSTSPIFDDSGRLVSSVHTMRDITEHKRAEEKIRESEEKYRSIIENSGDQIFMLNKGLKFMSVNKAGADVFGKSVQEMVGRSILEIFPETVADQFSKNIKNVFEKGKSIFLDEKIIVQSREFYNSTNLNPVKDDKGKVIAVTGIVRDITERKRMEEKVRESGEMFKNIFDNAGDGILVADMEKKTFLMGNKSICRMLGYNPEEIHNLGVMDIHPEKDIPYVIAQFEKQAKGEISLVRDLPVKRKDGTVLSADINATTVTSAGKIYLMGFFRDNTEHKQAEEALRKSEESFRLISENASDFITIVNREGVMLYASPSHRLLGYDPKEVVGKPVLDFVTAKDKEKINSLLQLLIQAEKEDLNQMFKEGNSDRYIYGIDDKSGNIHYLESTTNILPNNETGDFNILFVSRDVTERKQAEEELRTTRDYLEKLLGYANAPVIVWDTGRKISRFNKAFERMTGYSAEEVISRDLELLFPVESRETSLREIDRAAKGDNLETVEIPIQRKTGEVRLALWNSANIYSEDGKALLSTIAQGQDITERKRAEEALRQSEEKMKIMFESVGEGITVSDLQGKIVQLNESTVRIHGYSSKDELIGRNVFELIAESDRAKALEAMKKTSAWGQSGVMEYKFLRKDGSVFDADLTANLLKDNNDNPVGFIAVTRDITERKKAIDALRRSEEQFRLISENSSDLIALISMQGEYIYASPSHRRIGLEPGDLIGKSAFTSIHPDDAEKVMEIGMKFMSASHEELSRIAKEGANERINCRYIDGWGQIRHMQLTGDLVQDAATQGFNILLVCRDVTETKKMEEELLKNEKLQSLSVLAGGIAHDFNNLLAAILGNVSVALSTTDSQSEMHELLKDVETASRRAGGLVQQLLTFARGGSPVKKKMAIGQQLRDDVQISLSGSRMECEYSLPEDLWPVEVDPGQFRQVVSALVINAVQAMPEGGKIGVRAKNMKVGKEFGANLPEGEYVKISFRDSGKGIPPESLSKIFDPFFTTRPESSGLGLSAVYSIIKRHEGHITVDSPPGRGTIFTVYLPARREDGREESKPGLEKANGAKRVLVMDDELMVQKVTGRMLKQIGYEVEFAKDGQEAIEIYQKARETSRPFAAVIMDLTIPGGMGGKIAVQKLIEIDPLVKAIVSSGYSIDPVMSDYRKYGFRGVIAKPYRYEEMAEVMKQVIGD